MKLKIWLGISEVAGNFCRLKKGFESLGHEVEFIDICQHQFNYGDSTILPEELANIVELEKNRHIVLSTLNFLKSRKLYFFTIIFWKNYILSLKKLSYNLYKFISYFRHYDCLIFHYGNSFYLKSQLVLFNDLFWLKLFGIKVIFLMVGSDSRPAYVDFALLNSLTDTSVENILKTTKDIQQNNQFIEKYATHIVSNVFSSYFFSKPIISAQCIGNPSITPDTVPSVSSMSADSVEANKIKILHAPSRKDAKGTAEIIRIVNELIAQGENIHLTTISGVTNQEVIQEIQKCDFVIDQLYADFPLAAFAGEAASYKKPSIVGSYVSKDEFTKAYSELGLPPVLLCHPDKLKEAILKMTNDHAFRTRMGEDAAVYVSTITSPDQVAQRYVRLITKDYPEQWLVDPQQFIRNLAVGMTEEKMNSIMQSVTDSGHSHCLKSNSKKTLFECFISRIKAIRSPGGVFGNDA